MSATVERLLRDKSTSEWVQATSESNSGVSGAGPSVFKLCTVVVACFFDGRIPSNEPVPKSPPNLCTTREFRWLRRAQP
ncbi:uncharacterized protein B0H18DRAFT_1049035 [Fomitopsis serialis]|uniref:uncharacterized protein n=1 Tax=Fomitopsis serialis TaxID=139415 RepID=UPI002008877F|nr:uncharacterized protein B0H18DRAFT_1049035 [Neoantrodia serialis]KAH9913419.1 hypothetical protein B0H18DRAFT_1049035 [Neoantrodia serialis]